MSEQHPAGAPRALRVLALVAVCAGLAALAAAAFIFSYTGIHAVALQAGVHRRLARGYPLIFDVLLVVILAAVLALRGAGWPSRLLAWISLLALLAAAAGADALHASGSRLPHRPAEITAAILPWALVLIAFVLLLAMLRQARLRRSQAGQPAPPPKLQPHVPPPPSGAPLIPGLSVPAAPAAPAGPTAQAAAAAVVRPDPHETLKLVVPRQVTPALVSAPEAAAAPEPAAAPELASAPEPAPAPELAAEPKPAPAPEPAADPKPAADRGVGLEGDLALDSEPAPDDPSSDEAALDPADGVVPYPTDDSGGTSVMTGSLNPAPIADAAGDAGHEEESATETAGDEDADMPVFHRMWSSPVPPGDGG